MTTVTSYPIHQTTRTRDLYRGIYIEINYIYHLPRLSGCGITERFFKCWKENPY